MSEEMPLEFWQGVEQFNQHQFYDCHDTLEALWMEALEPEKTFYQGILQIAVALYHLGNYNLRGAIILLGEGMNRLRHYQPTFAGIDIAQLLSQSKALQSKLQQVSEQQTARLHPDPLGDSVSISQIADLPKIVRAAVTDD
jgi:uncharacterized protein